METDQDSAVRGGWGHSQDLVHLKIAEPLEDWLSVRDRLAITQTMVAYGWCVDEQQFDTLSTILSDDMVFNGSVVEQGPFESMAGIVFVPWLKDFMADRTDQLRHTFSNCIVTDQTADTATSIGYMTLISSTPDESKILATAFYEFTLVKVVQHWKIRTIYAGFDRQF